MQDIFQFLITHWFLTGLLVILLILLLIEEARTKGQMGKINPAQAVNLINRENGVVVDLRSRESFQSGHIVDAVNILASELEKDSTKIKKFQGRPIILVCETGQKSGTVALALKKQNIEPIYVLGGGINAWKSAQLPLIKKP